MGNTKKIPPSLLVFLFSGLLETEINSSTIPRETEKECSGFDHLLEEGGESRETGRKVCAMLKRQEEEGRHCGEERTRRGEEWKGWKVENKREKP